MGARLAGLVLLVCVVAFVLPVTVHGDFAISTYNSTLILTDHPNFYHALADEPTAVFPTGLSGGPYGPLFYYPTALWAGALDVFGVVDVDAWSGPGDPVFGSFGDLLVLKLPNLLVYALTAFVLGRMWRGARGETAAWLWLGNPAVVLFGLMMAQNDGWTALATMTALLFALRAVEDEPVRVGGRALPPAALAMLALAAGGAIKLSPALLVAPAAWVLGRDLRERAAFAALGFGAFALFIAPFVGTEFFWDHGLFARQQGQQPDLPRPALAAAYAAYLALVAGATRFDADRSRVLLASFLLLHALLYLLPPWSPQRSLLFVAVLAAAVPARRTMVAPYLLVTAVALVLALEHGQQIAAGLFEPMSDRVEFIGPVSGGELEPLTSVLYVLGALAWLGAIATLWLRGPVALPALRWAAPAMAALLVVGLGVYLGVAFRQLPSGVDSTPYKAAAAPVRVGAGETLALTFISSRDELRSVALDVAEGETDARVRVVDGNGVTMHEDVRAVAPGELRVELGRIEAARGMVLTLELEPEGPLALAGVEVPEELVAASASVGETTLEGRAPRYTLHHATSWTALRDGVRSQLRDGWLALVASGVVTTIVVGGVVLAPDRRGDRT